MLQLPQKRSLENLMQIENFYHKTGRHCGSTSLMDLMNWGGWPLSEGACFGIGSGLASIYVLPGDQYPAGYFMGRHLDLEINFFSHLGIEAPRRQFANFNEVHRYIDDRLESGLPSMIQADVSGVEYYNSPERFSGHKFIIAGKADKDTYLSADTAFPGLVKISVESLKRAMSQDTNLFPGKNTIFDINYPLHNLNEEIASIAVQKAIIRQRNELQKEETIRPSANEAAFYGKTSFQAMRENLDFEKISRSEHFISSCRFAYQVIDKRGTGRGAFRSLSADFFEELSEDRMFPFPVIDSIFSNKTQSLSLSQDLSKKLRLNLIICAKIASVYKMLSIKKKGLNQARTELIEHIASAEDQMHEISLQLGELEQNFRPLLA